jgi:hypothetical protein
VFRQVDEDQFPIQFLEENVGHKDQHVLPLLDSTKKEGMLMYLLWLGMVPHPGTVGNY